MGVRVAASWGGLLFSVNALRIAAAVGDFSPWPLLRENALGVGMLASLGVGLSLIGMLLSFAWWPVRGWRSLRLTPVLFVLLVLHTVTLTVFPARWVLTLVQTDELIFRLPTRRPVFALTIDDGLDPATTPMLLQTLRDHGARATFFVFGESLRDHPGLAQKCLAEGHELANHQMNDTPAVSLDARQTADQIERCHDLLMEFTTPAWFRPGGGVATDACKQAARDLGYTIALGSVFPFDTHLRSERFLSAYVAQRTAPGDIVVLHDGPGRGEQTAAVLERALAKLKERGLSAVTLSELVGR